MKHSISVALMFSLFAFPLVSSAQSFDQEFVETAGQGSAAEVEFGRLAQERAESEEVKSFGNRMVQDHQMALQDLKSAASEAGVQAPSGLGAEHRSTKQRLSQLQGSEFDREYMSLMVEDHHNDVELFRQADELAEHESLKAYASKTLPVLQEHLQQAEKISAAVR